MTDPVDTDALPAPKHSPECRGYSNGFTDRSQCTCGAVDNGPQDELGRLRRELEWITEHARQRAAAYEKMRAVIGNAPHGVPCASLGEYIGNPGPCTCWKADAL